MTILYGIKNCDTIKKARKWLESKEIEYTFHDFRTDGLTKELLQSLVNKSDWQVMTNKRSTTYKNLPEEIKNNLTDEVLFNTVLEQPTLLKRPLLALGDALHVGFKAEHYQELFK